MHQALTRQVGIGGAVVLGLGSIVGTGVYVGVGVAASVAGGGVVVAVVLGALLALANGLSSAQLAAVHPVAGGTYAYGRRYLSEEAGFAAGWLFLLAKAASAATAALGVGLAVRGLTGVDAVRGMALLAVLACTAVTLAGLRRSNVANALILLIAVGALAWFVGAAAWSGGGEPVVFDGWLRGGVPGVLEATALMFVAYTGYGRVATLGEEIRDPARSIPRAVVWTLAASAALYLLVAVAVVRLGGADGGVWTVGGLAGARLSPAAGVVLRVGGAVAMVGVLLNLLLGLSRVALAMGRAGDLPGGLARVDASGTTPGPAVVFVAVVVALLVCVGSVRATWSFSAFAVLLYYGLTNAAALALPADARRFPRWVAWAGLIGCVSLAWWVDWRAWAAGLGLLAAGFAWRGWWRVD